MSGYLGFDPSLLGPLLDVLRTAEIDLSGISSVDTEASGAMHRVADVRSMLRDQWIPLVNNLMSCQTMTGYVPATIGGNDLINSWLSSLIHGHGWVTSTDPLVTATQAMSLDQAIQLATWLSTLGDVLSPEDVAFLDLQLAQIAASPSLASSFLGQLTPEGQTNLANQVDAVFVDLSIKLANGGLTTDQDDQLAAIGRVFSSLGAVIAGCGEDNPYWTPTAEVVKDMDPHAAAMLVQHLGLGADELATVAATLIAREQQSPGPGGASYFGVRAADVLMKVILHTPDGASRFLVAIAGDPALLFANYDVSLTNQILLTGSMPSSLSAEEQAKVIPALVGYIDEITSRPVEPYGDTNPEILGVAAAMMAPYLVTLFATPSNPFAMSDDAIDDAWQFIVDHPAMVQYFLDERDRLGLTVDHLSTTTVDPRILTTELAHVAQLLAVLDNLYENARIDDAERDQANWNLAWIAFGLGFDLIPATVPVAIGADVTVIGAQHLLVQLGWGPDDVKDIRLDLLRDADTRAAILASVAVRATFDRLVGDGTVPAQAGPPLPDLGVDDVGLTYNNAVADWLEDADLDDESFLLLSTLGAILLSPHEAAGNSTELRFSDDDD